ncbi:methyl farnesoate epoxidase [Procambarus clarkii]|uniref:methyl farnesoate epoxidase n=1 Tax=Procambarus clarkii TaxID=6728 RepID=UPI003742538B
MLMLVGVALVLLVLYLASRKPRGYPPGPARLPLVGYLPYLEKQGPHKQLWRLSASYGPVIGLYIGTQPTVVTNGWDAVKESLLNDDLNGRPPNLFSEIIFNGEQRGVMFVENDFWKEQRRFTLHNFRNLGFGKRSHEEIIHEEARELLQEIQEANGSVTLQGMAGVSAINILWALLGGTRFSRKDARLMKLVNLLNEMFRTGNPVGELETIFPVLRHIMPQTSTVNSFISGFTSVNEFIKQAVEEHKANLDPDNPRDFMDIYITEINKTEHNPETTFSSDQLLALCSDVFTAGVETGSASVSFAVLLAVVHPRVMLNIQRELDAVVGHDRLPSTDNRTKLVYTEATLMETFRFRGAAPLTVPHKALRDTTLQGHRIPAGTMMMNNLYSIHMDPGYWGDPETFRPERFINADGSLRREERLIPFGKGRRVCLGESLARMTTFLLFTALLQHFTFVLDPAVPVPSTEGICGITLGPPAFKVFAKARF